MSRFRNWVGPATRDPGTARPTRPTTLHNTYGQQLAALLELIRSSPGTAGVTLPAALHDTYGQQLAALVELIRSGQAFTEPTTAERLLLPLVGVLTQVHQEHQVDAGARSAGRLRERGGPGLAAQPAPSTPPSPTTCPTPRPPIHGGRHEHEVCRESRPCRRRRFPMFSTCGVGAGR